MKNLKQKIIKKWYCPWCLKKENWIHSCYNAVSIYNYRYKQNKTYEELVYIIMGEIK